MKVICGERPKKQGEKIGNMDCKIDSRSKPMFDILGDYVHAIRSDDTIETLRPDTLYVGCMFSGNLHCIDEVNTVFDTSSESAYDELVQHIEVSYKDCCKEIFDLSRIRLNDNDICIMAVKILLNNKLTGYYLPDMNTWIVANWIWHPHYVTIVLKCMWPQLVRKLKLVPCANSLNGLQDSYKTVVTMGADPEFEVQKNGRIVKADQILDIRNYTSTSIGLDGASSQLEFRPQPGNSQQVVRNMRHLVRKFNSDYPNLDLTDAGHIYPLGGHIHVGLGYPVNCPPRLIEVLDDFIGRPTIELSGKARGSYKNLGMVRQQPHGFEYRSTPSAVFQNPRMAHIVLRLVKNLCEKYFNKETLEYNDIPTIDDYVNTGGLSTNQARYFHEFCKKYNPTKSLLASWKVPSPVIIEKTATFVPTVVFSDDWSESTRMNVLRYIQDNIMSSIPVTISFYGLNRDRGNYLSTINLYETEKIDFAPKQLWDGNTLNIGISYDLRKHGFGERRYSSLIASISQLINIYEIQARNSQ